MSDAQWTFLKSGNFSIERAEGVFLYTNEGQGIFEDIGPIDSGFGEPVSIHLVEIDADANLDLLIGSYDDGMIVWIEGIGDGSFGSPKTIGEASRVSSTWFADIDGDGDQDVLAALAREDAVVWYENNGSASDWKMTVVSDEVDNPKSVHAGDMDGDGDVDVLSTPSLGSRMRATVRLAHCRPLPIGRTELIRCMPPISTTTGCWTFFRHHPRTTKSHGTET